jgi:hypothetical protein
VAAEERPLTVEIHCEVTKRLLRLYEAEWNERIAAAEANRGDEKSLQRALSTITLRHHPLRAAACADQKTSLQALARFSSERQTEIRDYLESHRQDAAEIDAARKRVDVLIERFERLMEQAREARK